MKDILDDENPSYSELKQNRKPFIIISILGLAIGNILFWVWVIPFAQKSVNSHYGTEILTFPLFFAMIITFGIAIVKLTQKSIFAIIMFVYTLNILYWINKLSSLECYSCSMN